MKNILFLTWASYHRRPELLAKHFNANAFFISHGQKGNLLLLPFQYLHQAWKSWLVLRQEQPKIIFTQNPPIFCVMVAFLYSKLYNTQYVIDSHTGAFLSSKWRWSVGLHRILSRNALVTIVHNSDQEKIVKEWRCRYMVIGFTPGNYPHGTHFPLDGESNIAVISSFHEDEPLRLVFDAATLLPQVHLYITGDSKLIESSLASNTPSNCHLTGYLSYDQYIGLLEEADAIMVLTTSDHTLLMGAFEAVSLGTPLIVSDWPVLREYFSSGTIYVSNTIDGIRKGICLALNRHKILKKEILELREQLQVEWERKFDELQQVMENR